MPWFAAFMVLFAMANCGLPGTSGFVGEFMVILASFEANPWIALLAAFTLIIGAAYTLWLVKRVVFGDVTNRRGAHDDGHQSRARPACSPRSRRRCWRSASGRSR